MTLFRTAVSALLGATLLSTSPVQAEDRAVIIGINIYEHLKDGNLKQARGDALKFQDFAMNHLGLGRDQITLLLDQQATRKNIIETLVLDLKQRTKPGDRLIFFFAGHGSQMGDDSGEENDGKDELLVLAERGKKGEFGVLLDDELRYIFEKFPDRRILVVVDSCFSGSIARTSLADDEILQRGIRLEESDLLPPSLPGDADQGAEVGVRSRSGTLIPGQAHMDVWSAVAQDQVALEDRRGGVFTRLFLEGVGQGRADRNGNGRISNAELLAYVQQGSAAFCNRPNSCVTNKGRLTPEFSGLIERQVAFQAPEPMAVEAPQAPVPQAPPAPVVPVPAPVAPSPVQAPVVEAAPAPSEATVPQNTPQQQDGPVMTSPPALPDPPVVQAPIIAPDPVEEQNLPPATDTPPSGPDADDTGPVFTDPPALTQQDDAPQPPVFIPDLGTGGGLAQTPPSVQNTDLSCDRLKRPDGTQILGDLFLPSGNDALGLQIDPGQRLTLGDTVLFEVSANRSGQIVLFDLNPDCELFQIFPSVLSPQDAEVLDGRRRVEIPNALSANGQPIEIQVTEPSGQGHLLAVLVEDDIDVITSALPDYINLAPIPGGLDYLKDLANTLNLTLNDAAGARPSRWHSTIVPYTISR